MKNVLKLSLILFFFLTACDSDDSLEFQLDDALLPTKIVTTQSYDAEPQYDYTHITTFEYDGSDHLITMLKETYRRLNNETEDKNILVYSISTKLEYSLTENIVTQTDNIKFQVNSGYDTRTETRVYNIVSGENIIEVTLDSKYKETIELSKGLVVKYNRVAYSAIPEQTTFNYTQEYKYNDKGNISEYTYTTGNNDYTNTEKYSYDTYNGIYKHVNIPQWLFIVLFSNTGQTNNIKEIDTSHGDKFVPFAKNINKYNSSGYVSEVEYRPDPDWDGIWGSRTTYEYTKAKLTYEYLKN